MDSFYFLLFVLNSFFLEQVNKGVKGPHLTKRLVYLRFLASGSGDTTVRFWDLTTETPLCTARGIKLH